MKTNLLKTIAFAVVMTALYNCSVEPVEQLVPEQTIAQIVNASLPNADTPCDGQDPISRLSNNGNDIVNFEIYDANGNLLNSVYGLNPGEISEWKSFPAGMTTFTVSTSVSSKPVRINMGNCMAYDVAINENNQLDTDIPTQL